MRILTGTATVLAAMALGQIAAAQDTPRRGGILTHVVESETSTFDCHASGTSFTLQTVSPHYSTLLRFDPNDYSNVIGDLAESWEVSDDGTEYTFTLRDGVTFHDGSTFDAEDVKATWDKIVNPPEGIVSVRQARYSDITDISIIDPLTVRFTLDGPNSAAESLFASPWNCIYSADDLAEDPNYYAANINGTGPFKFVEYVQGSHWSYERFDDYFREGLPYLDGIKVSYLQGPGVINALMGGQVMGTFFLISPQDVKRVTDTRGDEVNAQAANNHIVNTLSINTTKPPFDDPRVRHALSLMIDRPLGQNVLEKITMLRQYGGLIPPDTEFALTQEELADLPGFSTDVEANRAEARRLLEEAGVPDLSFKLLNRNLRHPWEPLGVFLVDQWRQGGLNVEMDVTDTGGYFAQLNAKTYDVALDFNNTTTAQPAEVLSKYLPGNPADYTGQPEDPHMTELYQKISTSEDNAEIEALSDEFQRSVIETSAMIPMFWSFRPVVLDARVHGWSVPPSTVINLDMAEVWLSE